MELRPPCFCAAGRPAPGILLFGRMREGEPIKPALSCASMGMFIAPLPKPGDLDFGH